MRWNWQSWRCFDEVRGTFEEKGWGSWLPERLDNEVASLLAEFGEHRIAFFTHNPGSGVCVFGAPPPSWTTAATPRAAPRLPTTERCTSSPRPPLAEVLRGRRARQRRSA